MSSVVRPLTNVAFSSLFAAVLAASAMPAVAAKRQPLTPQPVVERSASGTIIQPTTTIIPDGTGHVRVIIIPRRRSYLDLGTEVSVGDRSFRDYVVALGAILAGPIGSMDRTFSGPDASRCQARSTALGSIRTHRFRA